MPGAGFMPKILAVLTILFGLVLIAARAAKARRFPSCDWSDGKHAAMVIVITAVAIALYRAARLSHHHDADDVRAARRGRAAQSAAAPASTASASSLLTYVTFEYVLKTPLSTGPFGF